MAAAVVLSVSTAPATLRCFLVALLPVFLGNLFTTACLHSHRSEWGTVHISVAMVSGPTPWHQAMHGRMSCRDLSSRVVHDCCCPRTTVANPWCLFPGALVASAALRPTHGVCFIQALHRLRQLLPPRLPSIQQPHHHVELSWHRTRGMLCGT